MVERWSSLCRVLGWLSHHTEKSGGASSWAHSPELAQSFKSSPKGSSEPSFTQTTNLLPQKGEGGLAPLSTSHTWLMVSLVSSIPGLLGDHSFLPFLLLNGPAHSSLFSPVWSPWDSSLEPRSPPLPLEVHFPNKALSYCFQTADLGLLLPAFQ